MNQMIEQSSQSKKVITRRIKMINIIQDRKDVLRKYNYKHTINENKSIIIVS